MNEATNGTAEKRNGLPNGDRPAAPKPAAKRRRPAMLPALLRAKAAAKYCGVSSTSWARMQAAGKIPEPVRLGGCVAWSRRTLLRWIDLGCPDRDSFAAIQKSRER